MLLRNNSTQRKIRRELIPVIRTNDVFELEQVKRDEEIVQRLLVHLMALWKTRKQDQ